MSKLKQVWHVCKGAGKPPEGVTGILLRNGELWSSPEEIHHMAFWKWQHGPEGYEFGDVVAYTLSEIRERVECGSCHGIGSDYVCGENFYCSDCNGKGHLWRTL